MFKNEEGFSLLELVVAVGVAGIIAAVALPTFAGLQDKATTTSATYAASASAAEALANSTMGVNGGATSAAKSSVIDNSPISTNCSICWTGEATYVPAGTGLSNSAITLKMIAPYQAEDFAARIISGELTKIKVGSTVYSVDYTVPWPKAQVSQADGMASIFITVTGPAGDAWVNLGPDYIILY